MSNWRVLLNSIDITASVSSWSASYAAENICGECTVEIADRAVLSGIIVPRVPRELSIQVDEHVDGTWTSRGAYYLEQITTPQDLNARTATIWGRSASARLTAPWAPKVNKQWSESTSVADIIAEVAGLCGVTVAVTNDFSVCANCYVAADQYPSEIIRDLADLSGQIVRPMVDGSVTIAPRLYTYGEPTVELDDSEIIVESVDRTAPDFGNRVLVEAPSTTSNTRVVVVPQYPESGCVEANGHDSVRLVAVVTDGDGSPVTSGTVTWAASGGTLAATETSLGEATIIGEEVQADSFTQVTLSMSANRVLGVYAYSDRSRRTNLYEWKQGAVAGDVITFAHGLDYYDQSLRVDYVVDGATTNTWVAGRTNADVTVTAFAGGASGVVTLYQGQAAECPSMITMEAHPPADGACMGVAVPITVTVIRDGRAAGTGMAKFSLDGPGELTTTSRALSATEIAEQVQVYSVGSERQAQLRAIPSGTVTLTDSDGATYANIVDRDVVAITSAVAEGVTLTARYMGGGVAITSWAPPRAEGRIGDVEDVSAEVSVYIADGSERGLRASVSVSARDCRELPPVDPEDPDVIPVTIDPCDPTTWPVFDPDDPTTWPASWASVNPEDPTTMPLAFDYCNSATWPAGFDPANSATWPRWMGTNFNPMLRSTWPTHTFDPTKPSTWPSFDPYDKDTWPGSVPQTANFGDPSTWPEGYDPCNPDTYPDTGPCDPFDPSTLPTTWTGNEDPCDYTTWPEECGADFNPTDPDTWPDNWTADSGDPGTWPEDDRDPDLGDDPTDDDNSWPDLDDEEEEPDPLSCTAEQIAARTPAYNGDWTAVAGVSSADNCPGTCTCDQICDAMRAAGKLGTQFYSQCVYGCTQARDAQCSACELSGPETLNPGETGTWTDDKGNTGEASGGLTLVSKSSAGYVMRMQTGGEGPFTVRVCYGANQSQCCEAVVNFPPCNVTGPSTLGPYEEGIYTSTLPVTATEPHIVGTMIEVRRDTANNTITMKLPSDCIGWYSAMYGGVQCAMQQVRNANEGETGFVSGPTTLEPGESGYFALLFESGDYSGLTYTGTLEMVQQSGTGAILRMPTVATGSYTASWTASCGRSATCTVYAGDTCPYPSSGCGVPVGMAVSLNGKCYVVTSAGGEGKCIGERGCWYTEIGGINGVYNLAICHYCYPEEGRIPAAISYYLEEI